MEQEVAKSNQVFRGLNENGKIKLELKSNIKNVKFRIKRENFTTNLFQIYHENKIIYSKEFDSNVVNAESEETNNEWTNKSEQGTKETIQSSVDTSDAQSDSRNLNKNYSNMESQESSEVKTIGKDTNNDINYIQKEIKTTDGSSPYLLNGNFEEPFMPNNSFKKVFQSEVPGWSTTAPDKLIERIRGNGGGHNNSVPPTIAEQGTEYYAEINANSAGMLYQNLKTTPGQVMSYSGWHKGRSGVDTMGVFIGPDLDTLQESNRKSTNKEKWEQFSGVYVVPEGQEQTIFGFKAISSVGGDSVGNYLTGLKIEILGELKTSKDANVKNVGFDEVFEYTINVSNTVQNSRIRNVVIKDQLPKELDLIPNSLSYDGQIKNIV